MQGQHSNTCWKENKRLLERARDSSVQKDDAEKPHFSDEEHPASEAVGFWLSTLSFTPACPLEDKPLSRQLDSVRKVVAAIVEAEESQILTASEADAVARFVLSKFVERRFDKTLRDLLSRSEGKWFLAASRYFNE